MDWGLMSAIWLLVMSTMALVMRWAHRKETKHLEAKLREAQDDRHTAIYFMNVASCRLHGVKHLANSALDTDGGRGGLHGLNGPYRGDPSSLVETLERIRDKASESLKEVCREVGCFKSLEEAGRFASEWTDDNYPVIVRHEEWDGVCWHVIHGSDVVKTEVDAVLEDIRRGHPVSITEAVDAIRSHEMGKKHGHAPLCSDLFKLSGVVADPERMKYSVDPETGVVTIEYEAVENPCRKCETGKPEPQCVGNCAHAEDS